ncbi:MAG: 4Fe-4S dicluster domain-containing protein [Lutibacter sp.]|nr:4Fe-4S dicluster domain-containing protein [Lutibacter sp.]
MKNKQTEEGGTDRRKFLKLGIMTSLTAIAGTSIVNNLAAQEEEGIAKPSGEVMRLLTPDGKIVEVDASNINNYPEAYITPEESRKGIPDRKFVMVIDLAKCKNARKCVEGCQKGHNLDYHQEFMQIKLIQDNPLAEPYWFPKNCMHCDEPPCVKVCPTGATYKREDNIVLVDNERCIGCKFCVTSCPYSARIFNWEHNAKFDDKSQPYSPETNVPGAIGTVTKCDFCPDLLRQGLLPHCAQSCPEGVIYFGDRNEDIVTNGAETVRFSELINKRAGYRHLEHLGTKPNVYYLPAVDKLYELEDGFDVNEEVKERYKNVPYVQELKKQGKI